MSSQFNYTGVIPILATPFHDDESLDLASLERLIRFNAAAGVDGITILGLLGESNGLDAGTAAQLAGLLDATFPGVDLRQPLTIAA